MPRKRLSVVVTRKLPEAVETRMRELFEVKLNDTDTAMTEAELAEAMATADVLVPTLTDRIDQKLLAQAGENLKLIANYGAGFDHIDVETARRRGILVSYTPGVLTEDTAVRTMALILAVPRRIKAGIELIQSGDLQGLSPTAIMG
ncbi:MAG: D-glycerate dehydrogenase, partial [Limibaculum sp.]